LGPRDDAGGRGAVLPGVGVAGVPQVLDQRLDVRVVEDDYRRLATELQVDALDRLCSRLRDLLTGGDVACQGDHLHLGMPHDTSADRLSVARDHVENAAGEEVGGQLGHPQSRQGRLLGGFENNGVSRSQGGANLPDRIIRG